MHVHQKFVNAIKIDRFYSGYIEQRDTLALCIYGVHTRGGHLIFFYLSVYRMYFRHTTQFIPHTSQRKTKQQNDNNIDKRPFKQITGMITRGATIIQLRRELFRIQNEHENMESPVLMEFSINKGASKNEKFFSQQLLFTVSLHD